MLMRCARFILLLPALAWLVGCTKYEFVIVDPPDLAGVVTSQGDTAFTTAAAEYRLRAAEGRLVMFIHNFGSTPMQLVTERSVVVSGDGASHPVIGQTIAEGSFIKLILPPPRPQLEPDWPGGNYGVSLSSGGYYRDDWAARSRYGDRGDRYHRQAYRGRYFGPFDGPYFYDPPSYTLYDSSNPTYWEWRGETQVTLTLSYNRDGQALEDRFVIHRRKAR